MSRTYHADGGRISRSVRFGLTSPLADVATIAARSEAERLAAKVLRARSSADKRRKSLDELSGREHGWWEQGATHRTVILDLMGYVPESWEVLKERLLALPENLLVVDYMLECVNRVEDGEFDPQWVTLPALLGHSG